MAKIAKKLTDTEIKSTKPADKEINLFDGDGLILRIAPLAKGGKKNWYFRYAVPVSKKRTKMSLGTYPHLTLAKARALRDENLSLLANGVDPQVHNNNKAKALKSATEHTLQAVARKWLDEKRPQVSHKTMQKTSGEAWREISFPDWVMFLSMRSGLNS